MSKCNKANAVFIFPEYRRSNYHLLCETDSESFILSQVFQPISLSPVVL